MWDYATHEVQTVTAASTLRDVIRLMATGGFRHVPVIDAFDRLIGIVSDRDVRRLLPSPETDPTDLETFVDHTRVFDIMTRALVTLERNASMQQAIQLVLENRIGALPIVEDERLVGILTQTDMLRAYSDLLGQPSGTLTIEETAPTYEELPFSPDQETSLVFVVEPDPTLRRGLAAMLRQAGIDVTAFVDLESLSDHTGVETPDLILLSARVDPDMDPLEMLHEGYPVTPVVITRAGAPRGEERPEGKGPLFLPCTPDALLARVRGEIGFNRWTHDLPVRPSTLRTSTTGTIDIDISVARPALVVDPDPLTRQILAYYLRAAGCEVTEAADGQEALSRLAVDVYDVITLELDLPYRSGFDVLNFLQCEAPDMPEVLVVSGRRADREVQEAFALGATDFIAKPLRPEVLDRRLGRASGSVPSDLVVQSAP